ncbi:M15 family metallopeptidase [Pseudoxanthomonas mexicana]
MAHQVKIPSDVALDEVTQSIMLEESYGFRFQKNEVEKSGSSKINKATFIHYEGSGFPSDCIVLDKDEAPKDHQREWAGKMVVKGVETDVYLFRLASSTASTLVVLKEGQKGRETEHWQNFLRGRGYLIEATGLFDLATKDATTKFQTAQKIEPDGMVGNRTYSRAAKLGLEIVNFEATPNSGYPVRPSFRPVETTDQRQKLFGKFDYVPAPTKSNPEAIKILGNWAKENLVKVVIPQLHGVAGAPSSGQITVHKLCAKPISDLFNDWDSAGFLGDVLSWEGSFVPRFIRGSRKTLSNHAFGTAFDINARYNPLGAEPAWTNERGCVFRLVELANKHGFYWGGHFSSRRDGMHFELADV